MSKNFKIAVVGGGSAGVMAALRGVLNNDEVILYMGSPKAKKRSRAQWVAKVENMPGHLDYKKGIMNPNVETLKWIRESEFSHLLTEVKTSVTEIIKNEDGSFIIKDEKGGEENAFAVVLATGVMDVQPHIQGSIAPILPYDDYYKRR
jgi:thioredoxin reductase (NADPH)